MGSLTKDRRRQLERTVAEARKIAEEGAEHSLRRLAVDVPRAHDSLTTAEKKLRVSLRAHSKQLGDRLDERPTRMIQAVAYEHWHRLLFARFLIENDLLLHPQHGVALSLNEVKELALAEGREWVEVAAEYAQRMLLRRVFQPEDPALSVSLSPEKRLQLEAELNSLPREVFLADDSLGWVYQFWQRDEKDRVNRSEVKIGADELAPVTQLFTEDYMVLFLLENTLGAWWTGRHGKPELPEYKWTYLRLNADGTPAAGTFDGWPTKARELRVLDPCMGSGHFLTFALPILARMRVAEEGLSLSEAVLSVLRDNLFGLELDPRCSQIAAFNLALTAWRLAGTHFDIPQLNLACSGLGINAKAEEWVKLAGKDERLRGAMTALYGLFEQAPVLGSLIDPKRVGGSLFVAEFEKVQPLLQSALGSEQQDETTLELAVTAQGLVKAAKILADTFTLVATNVPYLYRGKQVEVLREHCDRFHTDAKTDLATCFVDRCLSYCESGGTVGLVTPQNWLFLGAYGKLRERLLNAVELEFIVRLGPRAFETIGGEVVNVALLGLSRLKPAEDTSYVGLDATDKSTPAQKEIVLREGSTVLVSQKDQLKTPDARIGLEQSSSLPLLDRYAQAFQGISPADFAHYGRHFWELPVVKGWHFWQSTVDSTRSYGGRDLILWWNEDLTEAIKSGQAYVRGQEGWGKRGVVVSQMNELPVTLYTGERFDTNCAVIVPFDESNLPAIWAFCSSLEFNAAVRRIDKTLKVTNATLVKVPFDLARWQHVAAEKDGTSLPLARSDDATQWLLDGNPRWARQPLQVAVARLIGYQWPRQTGSSFLGCPALSKDDLDKHAEADGIVCLTSLAGKASAADRLRALLAEAYGEEWSATKLSELLEGSESLEVWLRDRFFENHCQVFHQRPFVWHVWDGRNDGFHALVNYHKLDHKRLEKLIYSYLGDWISRQRQDLTSGVEGADGRIVAAEHLQGELKKILDGEKPYDVFVRWKPLKGQPIGWDPDPNDGVRMNIRPWITEARLYRATKPGILRVPPNIKYGKDRGKEAKRDRKDFPWLEGTSDRNNDIHFSLGEKRRARGLG